MCQENCFLAHVGLQVEFFDNFIDNIHVKIDMLTLKCQDKLFTLHKAILLIGVYFLKIFNDVIRLFHHPEVFVIKHIPGTLIKDSEIRIYWAVTFQI